MRAQVLNLFLLFSLSLIADSAAAIEHPAAELGGAAITTQLGSKVDLGTKFIKADGSETTLSALVLEGRPLVVVPAYYHCPRLCGLVHDGATKLFNELGLKLGEDYRAVTISFDSNEKPSQALKVKNRVLKGLVTPATSDGWEFLLGTEDNVRTVMNQIGFGYLKDGEEFAHGSGIFVITPTGEVSQYFTGIEFPASDVRLGLVEASKGRIGTPIDHVLLYCFRFDPTKGRYTFMAGNIMRAGGVITLLALIWVFVVTLRRREARR